MGEGAVASLNEARHMRNEAMLAHSKVDEISNAMTSSQNTGVQETRNITQSILDYIASQPVNQGPEGGSGEPIEYRGALSIMLKGGEEYKAYKDRFFEENPHYSPQRVDVSKEQEKLNSSYNDIATKRGDENALRQHHSQDTETIHGQAHKASLELNGAAPTANADSSASMEWKEGMRPFEEKVSPGHQENSRSKASEVNALSSLQSSNKNLKDEISNRIGRVDEKMDNELEALDKQHESLTQAVKNSNEQTIVGTTIENLGTSVNSGIVGVAQVLNKPLGSSKVRLNQKLAQSETSSKE